MEFLVLSSALYRSIGGEAVRKSFEERSFDKRNAVKCSSHEGFEFLWKREHETPDTRVIFDGYMFLRSLHHPRYNPPDPEEIRAAMADILDVSGGFVLGEVQEGRFQITPDVLGQYHVFYHCCDDGFLVSNNPGILEDLLHSRPCTGHLANTLLYMSSFAGERASSEIPSVPPRHGIVWDRQRGLRVCEHVSRSDLYLPRGSYPEQLEVASTSIKRNCRMIAEFAQRHDVYVVVDLSGGVDTRMTTAGFIGAECEQEIFFCNVDNARDSNTASADRVAAETILSEFSLPAGAGIGAGKHGTVTLNSAFKYGVAAKAAFGMGHYFGQIPTAHADYGELVLDRFCRVGGYCGEHTRAPAPSPNFSNLIRNGSTAAQFADSLVQHLTREHAQSTAFLLTDAGKDIVRQKAVAYFAEVLAQLPAKLLNTVGYVENRSRCHFGMRSQNANRSSVSVSPLATPKILALHQHLAYADLFHNKIAHDLIVTMAGPNLAHLPFANYFWRPNVVSDYPAYDPRRIVTAAAARADFASVDPVDLPRTRGEAKVGEFECWRSARREQDTRGALLRFVLDATPDDAWRIVDREKFEDLAHLSDAALDSMKKGPMRAASALLFHARLDETHGLSEVFDPRPLLQEANERSRAGLSETSSR